MATAIKILVVDDMSIFRDPIAASLRLAGFETLCASDGQEALQAIRNHRPAVVLLDVSMPVMDGFDFLRYRNDDPKLSAVPVVLVTNAKPHERPTIGVNDVVRKPIDIDEILFAIKRYC